MNISEKLNNVKNLADLAKITNTKEFDDACRANNNLIATLPTFGGDCPYSDPSVVSWDEEFVLVYNGEAYTPKFKIERV